MFFLFVLSKLEEEEKDEAVADLYEQEKTREDNEFHYPIGPPELIDLLEANHVTGFYEDHGSTFYNCLLIDLFQVCTSSSTGRMER